MEEKHKCPVCGKYEFEEHGSFDICDNCHWMDDPIQEKDPDYEGGANIMSLNQMKKAYAGGMTYKPAKDAYNNGERWKND